MAEPEDSDPWPGRVYGVRMYDPNTAKSYQRFFAVDATGSGVVYYRKDTVEVMILEAVERTKQGLDFATGKPLPKEAEPSTPE